MANEKVNKKRKDFLLEYESRLIRAMSTIFTKPYYSLEGWSIIRYDRCVRNKTVWDTKCSIISIFSPSVTFLWCACNKWKKLKTCRCINTEKCKQTFDTTTIQCAPEKYYRTSDCNLSLGHKISTRCGIRFIWFLRHIYHSLGVENVFEWPLNDIIHRLVEC